MWGAILILFNIHVIIVMLACATGNAMASLLFSTKRKCIILMAKRSILNFPDKNLNKHTASCVN